MHSVFERLSSVPMYILRTKREKWLERRVILLSVSVLDSKTNVPSSTKKMQNVFKKVSDKKVPGWWLTNFKVDLSGLSLRANWALLNPRSVHFSSSVFEKAINRNRNSNGAMLSDCLKPNLKSMDF